MICLACASLSGSPIGPRPFTESPGSGAPSNLPPVEKVSKSKEDPFKKSHQKATKYIFDLFGNHPIHQLTSIPLTSSRADFMILWYSVSTGGILFLSFSFGILTRSSHTQKIWSFGEKDHFDTFSHWKIDHNETKRNRNQNRTENERNETGPDWFRRIRTSSRSRKNDIAIPATFTRNPVWAISY